MQYIVELTRIASKPEQRDRNSKNTSNHHYVARNKERACYLNLESMTKKTKDKYLETNKIAG